MLALDSDVCPTPVTYTVAPLNTYTFLNATHGGVKISGHKKPLPKPQADRQRTRHDLAYADDYNSKVLSARGGAGQRVGYTKTGPRASPNRITQNHIHACY